jgi:hypothetical protein
MIDDAKYSMVLSLPLDRPKTVHVTCNFLTFVDALMPDNQKTTSGAERGIVKFALAIWVPDPAQARMHIRSRKCKSYIKGRCTRLSR